MRVCVHARVVRVRVCVCVRARVCVCVYVCVCVRALAAPPSSTLSGSPVQ